MEGEGYFLFLFRITGYYSTRTVRYSTVLRVEHPSICTSRGKLEPHLESSHRFSHRVRSGLVCGEEGSAVKPAAPAQYTVRYCKVVSGFDFWSGGAAVHISISYCTLCCCLAPCEVITPSSKQRNQDTTGQDREQRAEGRE